MELITIEVTTTTITVKDGRVRGSKLKYVASGLEIYLIGPVPVTKRDKVRYVALEQVRARHMPLISLRSYGWV